MQIKDNNKCTFCKTETETLRHLFWGCRCIQVFWRDFQNYLISKNIVLPGDWNEQTIPFGSHKKDRIFNLLLFKAKYFIFVRKLKDFNPEFNSFINVMKSYYHIEKYNAVKNGNMPRFNKDWNTYKTLFQTWSVTYNCKRIPTFFPFLTFCLSIVFFCLLATRLGFNKKHSWVGTGLWYLSHMWTANAQVPSLLVHVYVVKN